MPTFAWTGQTRDGKNTKGTLDAANEASVTSILRRQGIQVNSVKAKGRSLGSGKSLIKPKIKIKDLVVFTRQFATMIDAGLPLIQCLEILSSQQPNRTFKEVLLKVREDVEAGSTFADALKKHPKAFNELYVNLVAAGEVGGILDTILHRLATYIEKAMQLRKKVKSAMTYPATVVGIALIVIAVILIFVIPAFEKMFKDFGGALPAPTQIVINISNAVQDYFIVIIVAIAFFIFIFKRIYATEKGHDTIDNWALRLPVFGVLIRKVAVAKFSRTMSTMISSGVPILDGLDIVRKTAGNRTVEKALAKVRSSISEGKTIAEPLKESGVFPPMVCQMIEVGEQAGALDTMLSKIADFYDDEVDDAVSNLTAMMEPMLMLFLGTTVGGLVIAMYLPIFKIAGTVAG